MNLLMLSGDSSVAKSEESAFSAMLKHFSAFWSRIDIICPHAVGATERELYGNVYVHPSPYHRVMQPLFIRQMGHALLAERPYGLVVSHDYGFFYNGVGALLLKHPYVSEIHHVEGYPHAASLRERLSLLAAKLYVQSIRKQVIAFRAVNHTEVPNLLRSWGVPAEKILVLPSLYIDFQQFHPKAGLEQRYDVAFVGRLAPNKGLFTLLDAIAQVRMTHPSVSLGILGRGRLEAALKACISALGLESNITLITEHQPVEAVARFYNQSKMVVCASTAEGGPRVTVEAMACGIPVISTPVGIMPELIRSGENGLLFSWDTGELVAHIRRLLDDDRLRHQLGKAGYESVQDFGAEAVISRYAAGYQALINHSAHGNYA